MPLMESDPTPIWRHATYGEENPFSKYENRGYRINTYGLVLRATVPDQLFKYAVVRSQDL